MTLSDRRIVRAGRDLGRERLADGAVLRDGLR
jgi:hypothetical protein